MGFWNSVIIAVLAAGNAALLGAVFRCSRQRARLSAFARRLGEAGDRASLLACLEAFLTRAAGCPEAVLYVRDGARFVPAEKCRKEPGKTDLPELWADGPAVSFARRKGRAVGEAAFWRSPEGRQALRGERELPERLRGGLLLPVTDQSGELNALAFLPAGEGRGQRFLRGRRLLNEAAPLAGNALKTVLLREQIRDAARQEHITQLWDRACFKALLDAELAKRQPLTLALLKPDDFRLYGELYGSDEGDRALRFFADTLKEIAGSLGILGCSGTELYLAFPDLSPTTVKGILKVCREKLTGYADGKRRLSFSGGLCAYPQGAGSRQELLSFAALGLEQAQRSGGDRTVIYGEDREAVLDRMEQLGQEYAPTVYALTAAIDAKDHYTFMHSENVTKLATQLAKAAGFEAEYVEMIRQAGLLHDVGKISIPESVLSKPGPLTPEEYRLMQSHVERSIEIIRHLPSLNYVLPIMVGHHERWDGKGYPRGLTGAEIPLGARCVALADAFDAMASRRVYKAAMPVKTAIDEIEKGLGTQFDPELGALFVELLRSGRIETGFDQNGGKTAGAAGRAGV